MTTSNAGSRELHAVTKARYQKQMREELLSKGVLVAHDSVTGWCDCILCTKSCYITLCVNVFAYVLMLWVLALESTRRRASGVTSR